MFTGIIRHLAVFKGYRQGKQEMALDVPSLARITIDPGESIALNGACLSLTRREGNLLFFNLSQETLQRTNLGTLKTGDLVNLELPLTLDSLLSGHFVTGHIDATGKVLRIVPKPPGKRFVVSFPSGLRPYFISKGSVAINGVSLTIADLKPSSLEVELIPITLKHSNLDGLKRGDAVNLECDIIGKYVYNWVVQGKRER